MIERIRADAPKVAFTGDPFFVAGSVLYWAEGSKTTNELSMADSDPLISRLFIGGVRTFHDRDAEFVLKLNLRRGILSPLLAPSGA